MYDISIIEPYKIRVFAKEPARVWFWSFDPPEDRNLINGS